MPCCGAAGPQGRPQRGSATASCRRLPVWRGATVAAALKALEGLGLVQRIKHRVLAIGANGGRVWKQLTSGYRLLIETTAREFNPRTDSQAKEITLVREAVPGRAVKAAQEALRLVAERMRERPAGEPRPLCLRSSARRSVEQQVGRPSPCCARPQPVCPQRQPQLGAQIREQTSRCRVRTGLAPR